MKKIVSIIAICFIALVFFSQPTKAQLMSADLDCNSLVEDIFYTKESRMCYVQTPVQTYDVGCYVRRSNTDVPRGCIFTNNTVYGNNGKVYEEFNCNVVGYAPLMQYGGLDFKKCALQNSNYDWAKVDWHSILDATPPPKEVQDKATTPPQRPKRYTDETFANSTSIAILDILFPQEGQHGIDKTTKIVTPPPNSGGGNGPPSTIPDDAIERVIQMVNGLKQECSGAVTSSNYSLCIPKIQPPISSNATAAINLSVERNTQLQCVGLVRAAYGQAFNKDIDFNNNAVAWAQNVPGYKFVPIADGISGKAQIKPHDLLIWEYTSYKCGSATCINHYGHIAYITKVFHNADNSINSFEYAEAEGFSGKVGIYTDTFLSNRYDGKLLGWQSNQSIPEPSIDPGNGGGTPNGSIVRYSQYDPRWANIPIVQGCPLSQAGCGPTTVASIVATYANKSIQPPDILTEYKNKGWAACGTDFSSVEKELTAHGFETSVQTEGRYIFDANIPNNVAAKAFRERLNNGWDGIAVYAQNPGTPQFGHYFWIAKVDANNTIWGVDSAWNVKVNPLPPMINETAMNVSYYKAFAFRHK